MTNVEKNTITDIFPLVRDAILAFSSFDKKFTVRNIYEYEPRHKSSNFLGLPYFWIKAPQITPEKTVFDNSVTENEFVTTVFLRVGYEARQKVREYNNYFLKAIMDYEDTFQENGYYDVMISLIDVNDSQEISQERIVESEFQITWQGTITR